MRGMKRYQYRFKSMGPYGMKLFSLIPTLALLNVYGEKVNLKARNLGAYIEEVVE